LGGWRGGGLEYNKTRGCAPSRHFQAFLILMWQKRGLNQQKKKELKRERERQRAL